MEVSRGSGGWQHYLLNYNEKYASDFVPIRMVLINLVTLTSMELHSY